MNDNEKFLDFNGKSISLLAVGGTWWVAVKPICEALGVDYVNQWENIKQDPILSEEAKEQSAVSANGSIRKMICLSEKFVYGWLFSVRSTNPKLIEFKRECYSILYDHFHGALTGRLNILKERTLIQMELADLQKKILASEDYQRLQTLKRDQKQKSNSLKHLDQNLIHGQLKFDV